MAMIFFYVYRQSGYGVICLNGLTENNTEERERERSSAKRQALLQINVEPTKATPQFLKWCGLGRGGGPGEYHARVVQPRIWEASLLRYHGSSSSDILPIWGLSFC